ncbi:MAG: hypothetical protein ACHQ7M_04345 [Chloroflexota bacterium]
MLTRRLAGATLSAVLATGLLAPVAFAQTTAPPGAKSGSVAGVSTATSTAGIGQNLNFCLASNASTAPLLSLAYPGDGSNLVVDATMTNLVGGDTSSVGLQVFDVANGSNVVETANLGNNEAHSNPSQIEVAYSSATGGTVQLRPFNVSPNQVCFTVSPVQLPNGVSSITMNGGGTVGSTTPSSASPRPSTAAAPLPSTPVSSKSAGIGQSLSFCLAPNASTAPTISLSYPGDNSDIVIKSSITGQPLEAPTSVGFNVFDAGSATTPVEIANLANNQFNGDPHLIQFAYGSATGGPLQIRPFNGSPNQVCFNVTPIQMPSGVSTVNLA